MIENFVTSIESLRSTALRTAVNKTTGKTPAELFLGRKIITPFRKLVRVTDGAEYVGGNIENLFDEARQNMQRQHKTWEKYYNRKRRAVSIKVNDFVLVQTHFICVVGRRVVGKFMPKCEGPYRVSNSEKSRRSRKPSGNENKSCKSDKGNAGLEDLRVKRNRAVDSTSTSERNIKSRTDESLKRRAVEEQECSLIGPVRPGQKIGEDTVPLRGDQSGLEGSQQVDSEEEVIRSLEDHPYLRRQEAIVEDDPSDDSSSETTVLLGRQTESPRNLQQSSSADVSEWEAFNKE
ncbi:uncharacterized protein TNCV_3614651 [Trichonephila clavipes]|uniref:Uncharacterized protein n=1 Tax=Trichonephila clavipes TaxID=2585209 RepID=A0A8X6SS49_TRICX|nr:uncharacterized protein TNCV_3614651 [Trichonephila clavipes]